jgi:hypothetical protein
MESRERARIEAAGAVLKPALDVLSALKPDVEAVRAFNERVKRWNAFNAGMARKPSLMVSLDSAETDAAQGAWMAVEPALRRMEAQLPECEAAMTAPEIEAMRTRLVALRTGVEGWRAEQAAREKEFAEAAAIEGELTRADRLLARVAFESDFDSADKRIEESTAALNGAETRLGSLKSVPTAELGARVAELRADLQRARGAVAANRASASARALVSKVVRDVAAMVATPGSQPDIARRDAECDAARQAVETNKQLPAAVVAELTEALRSAKARLADMRRGLDLEASKKPVIEAIGSAEQAAIEASELRAAADFATADEAALRASDALRRALEALRAVPDAAWRADMEQRIGLLDTRLKRVVDAIAVGRNVVALSSAIETAETDMREMAAARWKADREAIDTLMQEANIPGSARASAERTVARLESYQARHDALKELTGPIEEAIKARDYAGARALLDALRKKVVAPPLTADHVEFLNRLMSSYMERIESGEFWRKVSIVAAALGAVLVAALVALWMRGGASSSGSLDLRKWRTRVEELTRRAEQDRDRATSSDAARSEATDRIERSRAFGLNGVAPAIPGAASAEGAWLDALVLAHRLVVLGDADSARELLEAVERAGALRGSPAFKLLVDLGGPLAPSSAVRLARGCRAIEAAGAWAEVWKGSSPAIRDVVAARVERWFAIAIEWLPGHEDVPVFYERAIFAAEQGKREQALSLLTGERESAFARMKSLKASAVSPALKSRIYVLAAELSLDLAKVVSLRGGANERATSWPVLDRYQAPPPVANPTAAPATAVSGAPAPVDPATRIMNARNYLALASQALVPAPGLGSGASGLGAPSPYGVAGSPPAASEAISREDSASLRFLIGAATFRADLGSGQPQAERTLGDRALGEPEPSDPAVFDFDAHAGARSGMALRPGWSRLQPDIDSQLLGAEERRMVRDLRLNWVNWCLDRGNEFSLRNPQALPGFMQKAAWLTCRYWLWARDSATPEAAFARAELRKLVDRILDVKEEQGLGTFGFGASGSKPKRSLGPNGWKPSAEFPSPQDRAVHVLLLEIAGTEAPRCADCGTDLGGLPQGSPCPKCTRKPKCPQCGRETVGGRCAFCFEESKQDRRLGNVWLLPKEASATPPVDGKPVINALEVIDPTMSSTPVDGMFAWIDTGTNSPVRAVGVFGHDLRQEYTVPVRSVRKPAHELFGGGKLIGMVNQLAEFTFDGLKDIVGAFSVVLSRPARSEFGQPTGNQPQDGEVVSRIQVDGFVARPAPGRQPAPTIPVDLIEASLFDVSVVIAAIGVDAKPVSQPVDAPALGAVGGGFGMGGVNADAGEAWHALAQFFREELGVAQVYVKEELEERAKECEGKGLRAGKVNGFASSILDLDFIRSMVRQLSLRAEKDRDADAKAAWARLDPTVRAAMERLIRKFEERQRGCMNAQRLKECFGIQIDAEFKARCPYAGCDAELSAVPGATRCPKCGRDVDRSARCASCNIKLPAGSGPGARCAACMERGPQSDQPVSEGHRPEFTDIINSIIAADRSLREVAQDWLGSFAYNPILLDALLSRMQGKVQSHSGNTLPATRERLAECIGRIQRLRDKLKLGPFVR